MRFIESGENADVSDKIGKEYTLQEMNGMALNKSGQNGGGPKYY